MQKATRQHTKEHNRNLVLKTIIEHDQISRAEIARRTSLTRTTVSDIVADLLGAELVNEVGVGSSLVGKSPILLSLAEDSRYLVGLNLAYNRFSGAIVNLRGKIREIVSLPVSVQDHEKSLAVVYKILDQLVKAAFQPLVGIGIGTPGLVDTRDGVVVSAVNLDWENFPLARLLRERYNLPVYVLNDSQAAAIGEYTYGTDHKDDHNLVVINIQHGIGSGIIINGQLFQGDGGSAGEIGHMIVVPEGGSLCRCGNYGCLETVASAQAIINRYKMEVYQSGELRYSNLPDAFNLELIEKQFNSGDPLARKVILEAGRYLGLVISNLVGSLNIHKIVIVGIMRPFGKPWLEAVCESVLRSSLSKPAQDTVIEIGQLDGNGIILGASAILANDYSLLFNT
jgi:N-acetylglucosamine repressor